MQFKIKKSRALLFTEPGFYNYAENFGSFKFSDDLICHYNRLLTKISKITNGTRYFT